MITPEEVNAKKINFIPEEVIKAFDELIVENWDGRSATIKQKDIVQRIMSKLSCEEDLIFKKHYLDVEELYGSVGWEVEYSKPAYCDDYYEPYFVFSKSRK